MKQKFLEGKVTVQIKESEKEGLIFDLFVGNDLFDTAVYSYEDLKDYYSVLKGVEK